MASSKSGSGERTLYMNVDEQILSNDLNRQQRLRGADVAQAWRHMLNAPDTFSEALGSWHTFESFPKEIEIGAFDPGKGLRGDVFEGLLVLPAQGYKSLFITPGVVGLHDPDGQDGSSSSLDPNRDDSPYKIVYENKGIDTLEKLEVEPNVGPGIRIDFVECQRKEFVEEQASVNIYDPSSPTGFTPQTLDKIVANRLNFRVRKGVPAAGIPDLAQGWLPLAVISIPDGALLTDEMTFWDVRPVVRDRALRPYRGGNGQYTKLRTNMLYVDVVTNPGTEARINGIVRGETLVGGYTSGGRIYKGTPTATIGNGDLDYVDVLNTENQEPGFAPIANQIYYLWACFPKTLPRWVRYTENPPRIPNGTKGIPVVSTTGPVSGFHSLPTAAVVMPLSTGLVDSTQEATCLAALPSTGAAVPGAAMSDGEMIAFNDPIGAVPVASTLNSDTYELLEGLVFPANARAIKAVISCRLTGSATTLFSYRFDIRVLDSVGGTVIADVSQLSGNSVQGTSGAGGDLFITRTAIIPRIPPLSGNPGPNLVFRVDWFPSVATGKVDETALITGWKLAD